MNVASEVLAVHANDERAVGYARKAPMLPWRRLTFCVFQTCGRAGHDAIGCLMARRPQLLRLSIGLISSASSTDLL